jgi:hypothetical protein
MSGKINPKAYFFKEGIQAIFGFDLENYREYSESGDATKPGYGVEFQLGKDHELTFKQLNALSELLGTDCINFTTGESGYYYSSWTYDDGSPPVMRCWGCKVD